MEVEADFGWVQFNIGQGLIHSMNRAVSKWMSIHSVRQQQDPVEYYVICNNTQQTLYFGQVRNTVISLCLYVYLYHASLLTPLKFAVYCYHKINKCL